MVVGMFDGIDHLGIAVTELDGAVATYRECLGMSLVHREVMAEQGVEVALLETGEGHVELLAPLGPETPVGRYMAKNGAGLHHVAYAVDDIDATLEKLDAAGLRLIDSEPRVGIRESRVAFLHPRSTGGVLTEIVEPAGGH
jgi:methylmalonyl-CoA/ethylmalonyl-CoA epimerase